MHEKATCIGWFQVSVESNFIDIKLKSLFDSHISDSLQKNMSLQSLEYI